MVHGHPARGCREHQKPGLGGHQLRGSKNRRRADQPSDQNRAASCTEEDFRRGQPMVCVATDVWLHFEEAAIGLGALFLAAAGIRTQNRILGAPVSAEARRTRSPSPDHTLRPTGVRLWQPCWLLGRLGCYPAAVRRPACRRTTSVDGRCALLGRTAVDPTASGLARQGACFDSGFGLAGVTTAPASFTGMERRSRRAPRFVYSMIQVGVGRREANRNRNVGEKSPQINAGFRNARQSRSTPRRAREFRLDHAARSGKHSPAP